VLRHSAFANDLTGQCHAANLTNSAVCLPSIRRPFAEGIETDRQHEILQAAGCDYGQGYLFSKPVPPEEFEQLLVPQARHAAPATLNRQRRHPP
jgi:predicted signal transduction protein with EAL and GGDEF domain